MKKLYFVVLFVTCLVLSGVYYYYWYSPLTYSVVIPAELPEYVPLLGKGEPEHVGKKINAHEYYKRAHREGWDECISDYKAGRFPEKTRPIVLAELGVSASGRHDGYRQCYNALMKLVNE